MWHRCLVCLMLTAAEAQLRRQRRRRGGGWRPRAGQVNVIIFGPPGVGKGTQSKRIEEAYGLCHVSTGDILRREIAKKSKTGLEADRGGLRAVSREYGRHPASRDRQEVE